MNSNAATTDEYLQDLPDWQRDNLTRFRELVHKVSPDVNEEIKWGVPVFMIGKQMVLSMASFKAHTKYNFIKNGALLNDSGKLFNNGLESQKSRSIDLHEGETVDSAQLEDLIRQAFSD